jgi:SAM-dependent methyltransferase
MDISKIAQNLSYQDGIWRSKTVGQIAYPREGNKMCSEIEDESFWFKHRNRIILTAIQSFSPSATDFVDIGGGNGFTASHLSKHGYKTILVEPGFYGIMVAKQRGIDHLINSSFQDAGFLKGVFPNIGLFDVIEHIENDVAFLKQIKEVLADDGKLYITVPAFNYLWSQNDVNSQHYRRYTIRTFEQCAESAGFKIIYATYFFRLLPFTIFLFRSIPYRLGIRFRNLYSKASKEHKNGFASRLMNLASTSEVHTVEKKRRLNFGSSCLIVLQKR